MRSDILTSRLEPEPSEPEQSEPEPSEPEPYSVTAPAPPK
jgi:hypothetical protein